MGSSVLVVEDEPDLRLVIETALKNVGYEVEAAENGQQALELCEVRDPDVILTDLNMPVLSGRAFVLAYRALPTASARIVVMTGHDADGEAGSMGCDLGLLKPFSMDEVIAAVRYLSTSTPVSAPQ